MERLRRWHCQPFLHNINDFQEASLIYWSPDFYSGTSSVLTIQQTNVRESWKGHICYFSTLSPVCVSLFNFIAYFAQGCNCFTDAQDIIASWCNAMQTHGHPAFIIRTWISYSSSSLRSPDSAAMCIILDKNGRLNQKVSVILIVYCCQVTDSYLCHSCYFLKCWSWGNNLNKGGSVCVYVEREREKTTSFASRLQLPVL